MLKLTRDFLATNLLVGMAIGGAKVERAAGNDLGAILTVLTAMALVICGAVIAVRGIMASAQTEREKPPTP